MVLVPRGENTVISPAQLEEVRALISASDIVGISPYRYETIAINDSPFILAGTDFTQAQATSPFWAVTGEWPSARNEALVGQEIANTFRLQPGKSIAVSGTTAAGRPFEKSFIVSGILQTGGEEETFVFVSLDDYAACFSAAGAGADAGAGGGSDEPDAVYSGELPADHPALSDTSLACESCHASGAAATGVVTGEASGAATTTGATSGEATTAGTRAEAQDGYDVVELSVSGTSADLEFYLEQINTVASGAQAQLVRRVTQSEDTVLSKLSSLVYLVTIVVLLLTMICVATTMMAVVAERRREIGLRKALGATNGSVVMNFLGECLVMGFVGGALGSFLGFGLAQLVSLQVFNRTIDFPAAIVPLTIASSLIITTLACLLPVRNATKIDPAIVLKGE
jgi:putative ABC transport system permease protein